MRQFVRVHLKMKSNTRPKDGNFKAIIFKYQSTKLIMNAHFITCAVVVVVPNECVSIISPSNQSGTSRFFPAPSYNQEERVFLRSRTRVLL